MTKKRVFAVDDNQEWDELFEYLEENELSEEELKAIVLQALQDRMDEAVPDPDQWITTSYTMSYAEACGQMVLESGVTWADWKSPLGGFTEAQLSLPQSQKEQERWDKFHT